MNHEIFSSVEELFRQKAPDLLEFLKSDDPFWKQVKDNTITDEELEGHRALMEELGMYSVDSEIAKAVQILKHYRRTSLPTPINFI